MIKRALLSIVIFTAYLFSIQANDVELEYTSRVDWQKGALQIDVKADIGNSTSPGEARVDVEECLRQEIGAVFCASLYDLPLDSFRAVKDAVEEDGRLLAALLDLAGEATPLNTFLNTSLDTLTARYEFNLYPEIIAVFARHEVPYDPVDVIEYVPTAEYSGIVIYAKGEYPVHGEDPAKKNPELFHPSLMPRLYDSNMELVAEAQMMDPAYLRYWGTFGYTSSEDYLLHKERIGVTPLFTMARAVFGDNRTDLLIPEEAARRILSSPENRDLIRQGRILVICDLSSGN